MKEKILIIEDDFTIQTQLKTLLYGNGYEVFAVTDFSQTIEQLKEAAPHLVILDIKLPGNNGFEICSQIRTFSDIPIVFVTSSNTDMDELNSIMLGGDAFITKPYNPAILLAKIAALLKKAYRSPQTEIYMWREATLHLESSMIEYKGQKAELTKNELKILYYLFKNAGKICSRNDIVDFLWDNQLYVDDNTLSVNITRIRDKLATIGLVVTDFSQTIEQLKEAAPHLVILDIKLPGNNGFEICSQIRTFSDIPIVFVTSSNTDMDELNSIMLGGDAFITKPYNPAILLAKIAALLKKAYRSPQTEIYMWREATLHLESSMIEYKGQKAELTKNELKILYYLFKNAGKICSRNDIVDFLWDNQLYVDDNTLSVNITRIRDKLATIGLVDFIKTKHRQGYTL